MSFFDNLRLKARADKYRRRSDPGGIRFLLETLRPGDTALDIGAHKGGYAYWMLKQVGKDGKVYAFEPQLSLFEHLMKLKKSLRWSNCTASRFRTTCGQSEKLERPINPRSNFRSMAKAA